VKLEQTQREILFNQMKLDQTQIRAPMSGCHHHAQDKRRKVGSSFDVGKSSARTADINPVIIEAAVPEDDIGLVTPKQDVWLKANAVRRLRNSSDT